MPVKVLMLSLMKSDVVLLIDSLEYEGFNVLNISDVTDVLNTIESFKPDVILIDVLNPMISGFELCRIIKNNKISTPVMIFSDKNDSYEIKRSFEAGACDFIKEPLNPGEVIERINRVIKDNNRLKELSERFKKNELFYDDGKIYSRKMLDSIMSKEISKNLRKGLQITFMIIEVSNVTKNVIKNDARYDARYDIEQPYMKEVANVIFSSIREYDIISVYEKNKFAIVLQGAFTNEVKVICDRLIDRINKNTETLKLKPKINIAVFSNNVTENITPEYIYQFTENVLKENNNKIKGENNEQIYGN